MNTTENSTAKMTRDQAIELMKSAKTPAKWNTFREKVMIEMGIKVYDPKNFIYRVNMNHPDYQWFLENVDGKR